MSTQTNFIHFFRDIQRFFSSERSEPMSLREPLYTPDAPAITHAALDHFLNASPQPGRERIIIEPVIPFYG